MSSSKRDSHYEVQSIPEEAMEMVLSLKEITKCSEHEIYAMLKECNMDPNEAFQKLVSQDPFHEVRSGRKKKKKIKEAFESRSQGLSSSFSRNVGRGGSMQFSSTMSEASCGKYTYKEENSLKTSSSATSSSSMEGINRQPLSLSNSVAQTQRIGAGDVTASSSQPSAGFQSAWSGTPRQLSMADIVKMGRAHGNVSSTPIVSTGTSYSPHVTIHEPDITACQPVHHDECAVTEQSPAASSLSIWTENITVDMSPYQNHGHVLEHNEGSVGRSQLCVQNFSSVKDVGAAVSPATGLQNEELEVLPPGDSRAVNTATHLQVPTAEFSHMNFGSLASGINATRSRSSLTSDLEEASFSGGTTSAGQSDTRNPEYYGHEQLGSTSDWSVAPRTGAGSFKHNSSQYLQPDAAHGLQSTFTSSLPGGYTFESHTQLNAAQADSQIQSLTPFPNAMQEYANSLPSNLLASTIQPPRESEYLPQSLPTRSRNVMSSFHGPAVSLPERANAGVFSMPHLYLQTSPATSIAMGAEHSQHLNVHPYAEQNLSSGNFPDMAGYRNNAYMPSTSQQTYMGSNSAYESPTRAQNTGMNYTHPQSRNYGCVSNLSPLAAIASGQGNFRSSDNSYFLNPSTMHSTIGHDDMVSQYRDRSNFVALQQSVRSALWAHGLASRTVSSPPTRQYTNLERQNPLTQWERSQQSQQQPLQQYGDLDYSDFYYYSQLRASREHQQQLSRDRTSSNSQDQRSRQSQDQFRDQY